MTTQGPMRDPEDVDARFADIVSHWDEPPAPARPGTGSEPAASGPPPAQASPAAEVEFPRADSESAGTADPHPLFGDPVPWRVHELADPDGEEGYEPPPPAPLPSPMYDWPFYLALVGLVVGPLWLIVVAVAMPTEHSQMWMAGLLAAAGFITLVVRQPHERDGDDGDDGARV